MTENDEIEGFKKFLIKIFGKTFDELSLYVMSISTLLLYFVDKNFRNELHNYLKYTDDLRVFMILIGMLIGIFYSLFHAFSRSKKKFSHKSWMLYFGMSLQFAVAMVALFYSLQTEHVSVVFPLLNYFSALISYYLFDYNIISEKDIKDTDATLLEVFLSTLIVGIVIIVSIYIFKVHWLETLSISILLGNQISSVTHRMTSSLLKLQF